MNADENKAKANKRVVRFHKRPKVPPPDSSVWPEEYRGARWKPIYAFFFAGKCQLCAYSFGKPKWRQDRDRDHHETRMILCTNHPRSPGEMIEVLPTETCRNFKPKRWWTARSRSKPAASSPPPLGSEADPTVRHLPVGNDGLFATVDTADYKRLSRYKWFPMHRGRLTYAFCHLPGGKVMSMHRMLIRPRAHKVVDHIDGNGLNNRRCNLRECSQRQNLANTRPPRDAKLYGDTPHYIGVRRCRNKWQASITYRGKFYHLGLFDDPVAAAKARDRKAYEFWGSYAYLNFPEDFPPPAAKQEGKNGRRKEKRKTHKGRRR
jgi:hypothetical protein